MVVPYSSGSDMVDASGLAHSEPGRTSYEVAQPTGGVTIFLLAVDGVSYPALSVNRSPTSSSVKRYHSFSGLGYTSPSHVKLGM